MLKTELHTHINIDPEDVGEISYSAKDLIDNAEKKSFEILAITCHNYVYSDLEMEMYAQTKGILLLSGAELTIENKHVLVYNLTEDERKKIKTFDDLRMLKQNNKNIFVIAPHPFHFGICCLGKNVLKYFDLFDLWEYSFFYLKYFNPNKRTEHLAKKSDKRLVGNSDVHRLWSLGKTYTLIYSEKNKSAVFQALKTGKFKLVTEPLNIKEFLSIIWMIIISQFRK